MDCFSVVLDSVWFIIILERKQVSLWHEIMRVQFWSSFLLIGVIFELGFTEASDQVVSLLNISRFFLSCCWLIFSFIHIYVYEIVFYFMILKYHILTMQHIWFPCDVRQNEPTFLQMYSIFVFSWRSKRKITKWQNTILMWQRA